MNNQSTENINIASYSKLISPDEIKARLLINDETLQHVKRNRQTIRDILDRRDHRLFVVVGPCSIHDVDAALDYAA